MDRSGDLGLVCQYLEPASEESHDQTSVRYMLAKWNNKTVNGKDKKHHLERLLHLGTHYTKVLSRLANLSLA